MTLTSWPGAQRTDVQDGVAERLEDRPAAVDDVGRAAGHHEQLAGRGLVPAAADRSIDDADGGVLALEPDAGRRVDGAVHDDD